MDPLVSFDAQIVPANDPSISAVSSAVLYGKGVFTTIAVHNAAPFLWEKHWKRLSLDAAKLGISIQSFPEDKAAAAVEEVIRENQVVDGRLRLTFIDESSGAIWPSSGIRRARMLIMTAGLRPEQADLKVGICPHVANSTSPLRGIKSCNYMERMLSLDEARLAGHDEVIQVNDHGHVTSALIANVFWLKAGTLYTPDLRSGCLAGTTREFIIENLECREVLVPVRELDDATAIFLTSAGRGVSAVTEFESKKLAAVDHPILRLLPPRGCEGTSRRKTRPDGGSQSF